MGVVSLFSPYKIRRDANACIDCGKCVKVCPSQLPVDKKLQIRSAECTACMSCVDICPAQNALQFALPPKSTVAHNGDAKGLHQRWQGRKLSGIAVGLSIIVIVSGVIGIAKVTGHWETQIPDKMYRMLIPRAQALAHP